MQLAVGEEPAVAAVEAAPMWREWAVNNSAGTPKACTTLKNGGELETGEQKAIHVGKENGMPFGSGSEIFLQCKASAWQTHGPANSNILPCPLLVSL